MTTEVVTEIKTVDFHGAKLQTFEHDGERYVVMRPVVEAIGIAWASQFKKLTSGGHNWSVAMFITDDAAGNQREMVCMPLRNYPFWLATMNPLKVPDLAVRARVMLFKEMSTEALYQFWMTGSATMESVKREIDPDRVREELERIAEQAVCSCPCSWQ